MLDRCVLRTDLESKGVGLDETALAAAVIGQAFQDIDVFLRFMYRCGVHSTFGKAHRKAMANRRYLETCADCASAVQFLSHPLRHNDRAVWCDLLGIDPDALVEYTVKNYEFLEKEINHNFSVDKQCNNVVGTSTTSVWIDHNERKRKFLPGKKSKRGRRAKSELCTAESVLPQHPADVQLPSRV